MALFAVTLNRKGVLTFVVAGAAGIPLFHICHGSIQGDCLVRKNLCVAFGACVCLDMNVVAERGFTRFCLEGDPARI